MSSLSLAWGRRGQVCSRSLLAAAILFGLSVAAFGDTINTINSGNDPFITYTTGALNTDCVGGGPIACVDASTVDSGGPVFGADTDQQYFAFTVDATFPVYMYTSGFFYSGFAPSLSLFEAPVAPPILFPALDPPSPDYSGYGLLAQSTIGGPPCNLPVAQNSPTGAVNTGDTGGGVCLDANLSQILNAGSYLLVLTEYGNIANGPTLGDGFQYSNYQDQIGTDPETGLPVLGGPNFTSDTGGPCPGDGNTPFLNQNSCVAAAQGGNWITTIDVVTSPEPEPGVLVIIGTLLIFGSKRVLSSFGNRQDKK